MATATTKTPPEPETTASTVHQIVIRLREWASGPAAHNPENADYIELIAEAAKQLERLDGIVGCVTRNCVHIDDTSPKDEAGPMCGPTWAKVAHVCGLGSTSAIALCREFEVDPHHDCSRASEGNPHGRFIFV